MSQENTGTLGEKHENPPLSDTSSLGLPRELVEAVELMFFVFFVFV